ncbi:hypothetical protein [Haloarchaeobius sp. DYHT-AS-18]|uniref:hypothetical protein n=1 Tax=Haloarchaeobius sp. DYHT-AS-18 TaxID=3446117 RepID=UPI003EBBEAD5
MSKRMLVAVFLLSIAVAGLSAGVVVSDVDQSPDSPVPTVPDHHAATGHSHQLGQNDTRNCYGIDGYPACPFR